MHLRPSSRRVLAETSSSLLIGMDLENERSAQGAEVPAPRRPVGLPGFGRSERIRWKARHSPTRKFSGNGDQSSGVAHSLYDLLFQPSLAGCDRVKFSLSTLLDDEPFSAPQLHYASVAGCSTQAWPAAQSLTDKGIYDPRRTRRRTSTRRAQGSGGRFRMCRVMLQMRVLLRAWKPLHPSPSRCPKKMSLHPPIQGVRPPSP